MTVSVEGSTVRIVRMVGFVPSEFAMTTCAEEYIAKVDPTNSVTGDPATAGCVRVVLTISSTRCPEISTMRSFAVRVFDTVGGAGRIGGIIGKLLPCPSFCELHSRLGRGQGVLSFSLQFLPQLLTPLLRLRDLLRRFLQELAPVPRSQDLRHHA